MQQHIEKLKSLGRLSRQTLWGFLALWLLCISGLPLVLGLDIELMPKSSLMYQIFYWSEPYFVEVNGQLQEIDIFQYTSNAMKAVLVSLSVTIALLAIGIVWSIDRLFCHYSLGEVFHLASVKLIQKIGVLMVALFGASSLFETLLTYKMDTIDELLGLYPEGMEDDFLMQFFTLSLDSSLLLSGLFLVLMAKVMRLAVELQQEVDSTV